MYILCRTFDTTFIRFLLIKGKYVSLEGRASLSQQRLVTIFTELQTSQVKNKYPHDDAVLKFLKEPCPIT